MRAHFLLPALNEEANIERLIEKLASLARHLQIDYSITVVDDGSTDSTAAIVQRLAKTHSHLHLVSHQKNLGPGRAFDSGYRSILAGADDTDVIISMDADNTHSEQTIRMMLARVSEGYELVIASVFAPGGMLIGLPFLRYVLTIGCNMLYRILFPVPGIKEYTGFYRAIVAGSLKRAMQLFEARGEQLISVPGFGCAAELLIKCRRVPLFMTEVPMMVRYNQKGGKSKLRIGRTIREHLGILRANLLQRNVI